MPAYKEPEEEALMVNTRRFGPIEFGTRPYRHWRLTLPFGIKVMSTPQTCIVYRARGNSLRPLPGGRCLYRLHGEAP